MAIIELKSYKDELNYRTDTLMSKAIYDIKKTELKNYMCQAGGVFRIQDHSVRSEVLQFSHRYGVGRSEDRLRSILCNKT